MQPTAVNWTLLLFYGSELLICWRPVVTLFARVCSCVSSCIRWSGGKSETKWKICWNLFCSFKRCLGTTKQRLMDTWTSWRRPQGKIWTLRTRMAWLPPYWLLSMDTSMLFSSYAAESKHDTLLYITCAPSHTKRTRYWNNLWP